MSAKTKRSANPSVSFWDFDLRKKTFVLLLLGLSLFGVAVWAGRVYIDRLNAQKVIVLVTRFDGDESKYAIRERVLEDIRLAARDMPQVEIIVSDELVSAKLGSAYARQLGEKAQADLVVWAWYQANVAPIANVLVEDVSPAAPGMQLNTEASLPQPNVAYLNSFQTRRAFDAQSDTFVNLISALLNYKSGNYQAFLDRSAQVLAKKDIADYVVPYDLDFYIGVSHTVRNEAELALEAYNLALKANRKGGAALSNRALAYIDLKEYDLAVKDCTTALVVDIQYVPAYNNRGIAYLGMKQYERALEDFNNAIARAPDDPRAYHNRALAYQALGQTDYAALDLKKEAELRKNP